MNTSKKNIAIQLLAFLGLALTIKLAFIYYSANYDQYSLSSFCSINDFIDCDGAAKTNTAQFWGIPLAYWGIFFYLIIIFLTFVDKLKNIKLLKFLEVFKNPMSYVTVLGTIAFFISMILAGISLFKINKICILCIATYLIDFIIALVAADGMFKIIVKDFKTTILDFLDGAKKYFKTFIILVVATSCFLAYSGLTLNFVPHIKQRKQIVKYIKMEKNPYSINGNTLGNPNGDVVIELYSDFVCSLCRVQNIMLHRAATEYKNVKVIHHNYPFDKECNPDITISLHSYACFMAKVAIASENQNNYWGMSSLLYKNNPRNVEKALSLAIELGLNEAQFLKDLYSKKTSEKLKEEIEAANILEIDATPTMIIKGEKIVGVKPYYELKKILEKYGAKK